jgi:tetratricopeptide (TPR) repeat protein
VVVPVLALILDIAINRRPLRVALRSVVPWAILVIPCVIWTRSIQSAPPTVDELVPVWSRPFIAAHSMAFYLWKLFVPRPLGIDYGLTPVRVWGSAWSRIAWIIPAALIAVAAFRWRRWPALWAGVVIFLLGMLPNSGLVRFDYEYISTTADRYVYLSMLGAALVFAAVLSSLALRRATPVAVAVLAACAGLTIAQTLAWRDGQALFDHAIAVNPRSWMARGNLASLMSTRDPDRAIALNRMAIDLNPEYWYARNNLAAMQVDRSPDDAIAQCRYVLAHKLTYASAWNNLGCALRRTGDTTGARDAFARGYEVAPDNEVLASNYADALLEAGENDKAAAVFRSLLAANPDSSIAKAGLARALASGAPTTKR